MKGSTIYNESYTFDFEPGRVFSASLEYDFPSSFLTNSKK